MDAKHIDILSGFAGQNFTDPEAERCVLAFYLNEQTADNLLKDAGLDLDADCFTTRLNRAIFDACGKGADNNEFGPWEVSKYLTEENTGILDSGTRLVQVAEIYGDSPLPTMASMYAKRLVDLRAKRAAKGVLISAARRMLDGQDMQEIAFSLREDMDRIQVTPLSADVKRVSVDLSEDIPAPVAVITRGRDEVLHMGDIQMLTGLMKVGKTRVAEAIAAAVLGGPPEDCLGFECPLEDARILYVDTEMQVGYTAKMGKRILRAAHLPVNNNHPRMTILNLRECPAERQKDIFFQAIRSFKPQVAILDGIVDLLATGDFNDLGESTEIVKKLMAASKEYECAILSVIHTNPKEIDKPKAQGHLGTMLMKKSSIEINVKASGEDNEALREVHFRHVRYIKPEDFCFKIEDFGAVLASPPPESSTPKNVAGLEDLFSRIMKEGEPVSYSILTQRIMENSKPRVKERTAKARIKDAFIAGVIQKTEAGQYYLPFEDLPPD